MDRRLASAVALLSLSMALAACVSPSDPLGRQDALEDAQKRYTDLVRWGELEKASLFVDPALREEFLGLSGDYEALRITDFETSEIEFGEGDVNVTVVYKGYLTSTLVERTAREEQTWYRDAGLKNVWHVRPQLAEVLDALRGRIPETAAGF